MFCKYCGKKIDKDSRFCKHCGNDLESNSQQQSKSTHNLLSWFLSLSKKRQICLMAYIIWLLGWGVISIGVAAEEPSASICLFLIFAIIVPLILVFAWHYNKHLRKKSLNNEITVENDSCSNQVTADASTNSNQDSNFGPDVVKTYPLVEFAKEHGKMQLIREYDKKTCSYQISFIFTDQTGKITTVLPSESTKNLTTEQITYLKYNMYIIEYQNGTFYLENTNYYARPDNEYMSKLDNT